MVGPVSVPAAVDRPEFVVQVAPNRVDVDEFNRWAAPLNDGIAQAVAGDLVKLLGTPNVASAPMANFAPAYRVTIDVQRFDSVPGQAALIEAVWTVHKTAGGETRSGRTVAREAVQGDGFDALAAAHSRALAKMSGDIAAAIRAEAEDQRSQISRSRRPLRLGTARLSREDSVLERIAGSSSSQSRAAQTHCAAGGDRGFVHGAAIDRRRRNRHRRVQ